LVRCAAAGSGNAGCAQRPVGGEAVLATQRHRSRALLADRAVLFKHSSWYVQQRLLYTIGIGDYPADEHCAAAGYRGDRGGKLPTRTALSGAEGLASLLEDSNELVVQVSQSHRAHPQCAVPRCSRAHPAADRSSLVRLL